MEERIKTGQSIESVPVLRAEVEAVCRECSEQVEPRFLPATTFVDDRGWSIMNQFQGVLSPAGQINYSVMYPGVVKAWHRHQQQTDYWLCIGGHMKVGVYRDDGRAWQIVVGEKRPGVIVIPPPLWHGAATVGHEPCGLLYYVTKAYNPSNPDEERLAHDHVEGFNWGIEHK